MLEMQIGVKGCSGNIYVFILLEHQFCVYIYIYIYIHTIPTLWLRNISVLVQATYNEYIVLNYQCHIADAIRISHMCRVMYNTALYS